MRIVGEGMGGGVGQVGNRVGEVHHGRSRMVMGEVQDVTGIDKTIIVLCANLLISG